MNGNRVTCAHSARHHCTYLIGVCCITYGYSLGPEYVGENAKMFLLPSFVSEMMVGGSGAVAVAVVAAFMDNSIQSNSSHDSFLSDLSVIFL